MSRYLRPIFNILIIVLILLIISLAIGSLLVFRFSQSVNRPPLYFVNLLLESDKSIKRSPISSVNIVLLGLDPRNDRLEKTETTDTIIVANISPQSNKINLISVPRDLWFYETNSKVNEIYPLADKSKDLSLIKSNFSLLTGQNINNYLIISTQDLIDFVTVINGVDVNLEKGFVDKQYPNPEYIVNPKPETPIYVTVEFKAGVNHLDGSNITQFVRSRKSSDNPNEGGTDLGRIKRQQILFAAILSKLSRADFYTKTSNLAKLYNFWSTHLKTDLTDTDITRIALSFGKELNHININRSELSVADSSSGPGLIYHPNSFINKQWVFIPKTKDYSDIKKFFLETFK